MKDTDQFALTVMSVLHSRLKELLESDYHDETTNTDSSRTF